jgi:hypothetical protein
VNLPPQSMPAAGASALFSAMLEMFVSGVRYIRRIFRVDKINGIDETNGAYGAYLCQLQMAFEIKGVSYQRSKSLLGQS